MHGPWIDFARFEKCSDEAGLQRGIGVERMSVPLLRPPPTRARYSRFMHATAIIQTYAVSLQINTILARRGNSE